MRYKPSAFALLLLNLCVTCVAAMAWRHFTAPPAWWLPQVIRFTSYSPVFRVLQARRHVAVIVLLLMSLFKVLFFIWHLFYLTRNFVEFSKYFGHFTWLHVTWPTSWHDLEKAWYVLQVSCEVNKLPNETVQKIAMSIHSSNRFWSLRI